MKYAVILPDGAADEPVPELEGKTPLEAACIDHMDEIASAGRLGRVVTVPRGFTPGSDVATMSLFGYNPQRDHHGRAPLEAAARGITAADGQLIFRCNFITVVDGRMEDFTAGHIGQQEADHLIADLNKALGGDGCQFHAGVSYRNLLVMTMPDGTRLRATPPHDIPGEPVAGYLPRGQGAEIVHAMMERAREVLTDHEVNRVRVDLGENPATDIWLWGQGRPSRLQPFRSRYGVRGAVIAAVDLIRGIARSADMSIIDVPGATGYLDTDYAAKGRAAVAALDEFDLVAVHIEAPDEAGHLGDARAKVTALEEIDKHVVGPVLAKLKTLPEWRVLVAPDHPTPVGTRIHSPEPPPFCMAGTRVPTVHKRPFTEAAARQADLRVDPGWELMEFFLRS